MERLWAVAWLLGEGMQSGLAERGLTLARAELLWQLQRNGACAQSALSAALRVTPRNITGLVDALEADGLVARSAHPSDRRATLVSLTEKGKATTAAMGRDQERFARELFADASSEELASLVGWLDRLLGRIRARLD
jgi:DNA-binding MarR family transcriptional regulator